MCFVIIEDLGNDVGHVRDRLKFRRLVSWVLAGSRAPRGGLGRGGDFQRYYFDGLIDEVRVCNTTRTNFYHVVNEATLTLGSEEEEEEAEIDKPRKNIMSGGILK